MDYVSQEEANLALEVYGDAIINKQNINYIAVVKSKNNPGYEFEIGTTDGDSSRINPLVQNQADEIDCILNTENLPSEVQVPQKEILSKEIIFDNINFSNKKIAINETTSSGFTIDDSLPSISKKEISKKSPVSSGTSINVFGYLPGTLGGIFELEDFPNLFFGISNWHVLSNGLNKNDIIFPGKNYANRRESNKYKIGDLFWNLLDLRREVSFFVFDKKQTYRIKPITNCKYAFSGDISEPVVGDYVKKCGATSGCNENDKVCNCKKIYSTNAIIKVSGGSFSGKVFKNQILIHKFSEGGDSGSLIVDKNHDIVGLLFARSLEPYKFSVANNINYIFNHRFSINQDVYLDGQKISINQFNLKRFI